MNKNTAKLALLFFFSFFLLLVNPGAFAAVRGIYLTQTTAENTEYLQYLIRRAKAVGINTFVIDLEIPSKKYQKNVGLVKSNNISYVARVVIFPGGGTHAQVTSEAYWEKRYRLVEQAVAYGADQIQLDYIRYSSKQRPSSENAKNVNKVIGWFKNKLEQKNVPLQIDVFGVASFGESKYIGQNLKLFSQNVDAMCPMVYPSHYEPYLKHAVTPYETVYSSLTAIKEQFDNKPPMKLIAYIELSNYRYPMSNSKRTTYINAQLRAVRDAGVDGWYAWSAHNKYEKLFQILEGGQPAAAPEKLAEKQPENKLNMTSVFESNQPFGWSLKFSFCATAPGKV